MLAYVTVSEKRGSLHKIFELSISNQSPVLENTMNQETASMCGCGAIPVHILFGSCTFPT